MDIVTLLKVIVRRWLVVVPVLLLVVIAGQRTVSGIDPEYDSTAQVLLLPPTDESAPGSNPFLGFGNYLNTTGVALQAIMGDSSRHEEVARAGFSADYTLSVDTQAPILHLSVKAHSASLANRTASRLINQLATELRTNQDAVGARPANQITMKVLTQPVASKANAQQNRALVAFAVAGFAAVAGVAVTVESWALARARRRGGGSGSGSGSVAVDGAAFEPAVHRPAPRSDTVPPARNGARRQPASSTINANDLLLKGVRWGARRTRSSSSDR